MNNTELNITHLFADDSAFVPSDCSNNRATLGDNAGALTWNASKETAAIMTPLLDSDEKKEQFRDWVKSSGGWTRDEINAWSDLELNALLLQWIAGDVREAFGDAELAEWDWKQYEKDSESGRVSSRLFKDDDGNVYFSISE
jgi:hypothetical protein